MLRTTIILSPLYIFLIVIFYWMYQTNHTLPSKVILSEVTTPEVKVGNDLFFRVQFYRYTSCHLDRAIYLLNGERQIRLTNEQYSVLKPEDTTRLLDVEAHVNIPKNIPPGKYQFEVSVIYNCNPLDSFITRSEIIQYGSVTILPLEETK